MTEEQLEVLDSHAHVVSVARAARNAAEGGHPRISRPHRIEELWAVQPRPIPVVLMESDRPSGDENDRLLSIAAAHPLVVAVIGRLDLTQPEADEELARLTSTDGAGQWRGPRLALRRDIEDPWSDEAARRTESLGQAGLVLELLSPWERLGDAWEIAAATSCTVVLDHLGLPPWHGTVEEWAGWEAAITRFARLAHVAVKFSGLPVAGSNVTLESRIARATDIALSLFGPGRLMYGSNWPWPAPGSVPDEDYPLARTLAVARELSGHEAAALMGGTAVRVYSLNTDLSID